MILLFFPLFHIIILDLQISLLHSITSGMPRGSVLETFLYEYLYPLLVFIYTVINSSSHNLMMLFKNLQNHLNFFSYWATFLNSLVIFLPITDHYPGKRNIII